MVKWETEQATVKLLDDVSSGEVEEEETEDPEGDENVCDETISILDSKSIVESKTMNKLSNESKSTLETSEPTSDNENENDNKE